MKRLEGKYCKIITKEPGKERASIVTDIFEDVDYKDSFILVDSKQGLDCLRIDTMIAIKPKSKDNGCGKYKKSLKESEVGKVRIGTFISFIAMILIFIFAREDEKCDLDV